VREESQLDDMRAAIRGDFERLEQRLGSQELMHVREPERDVSAEVLAAPENGAEEKPRPSWLSRLVAVIAPRQV
jgi:hypothetical protein